MSYNHSPVRTIDEYPINICFLCHFRIQGHQHDASGPLRDLLSCETAMKQLGHTEHSLDMANPRPRLVLSVFHSSPDNGTPSNLRSPVLPPPHPAATVIRPKRVLTKLCMHDQPPGPLLKYLRANIVLVCSFFISFAMSVSPDFREPVRNVCPAIYLYRFFHAS